MYKHISDGYYAEFNKKALEILKLREKKNYAQFNNLSEATCLYFNKKHSELVCDFERDINSFLLHFANYEQLILYLSQLKLQFENDKTFVLNRDSNIANESSMRFFDDNKIDVSSAKNCETAITILEANMLASEEREMFEYIKDQGLQPFNNLNVNEREGGEIFEVPVWIIQALADTADLYKDNLINTTEELAPYRNSYTKKIESENVCREYLKDDYKDLYGLLDMANELLHRVGIGEDEEGETLVDKARSGASKIAAYLVGGNLYQKTAEIEHVNKVCDFKVETIPCTYRDIYAILNNSAMFNINHFHIFDVALSYVCYGGYIVNIDEWDVINMRELARCEHSYKRQLNISKGIEKDPYVNYTKEQLEFFKIAYEEYVFKNEDNCYRYSDGNFLDANNNVVSERKLLVSAYDGLGSLCDDKKTLDEIIVNILTATNKEDDLEMSA